MKQQILTFHNFGHAELVEQDFVLPAGHTQVRVEYSTVSPGTELFCVREAVKSGKPVQPGYILAGYDEAGQRCFLFPSLEESFACHCNVKAVGPNSLLLPLAAGVAPEEAGFLRFINIGLHAFAALPARPAKVLVVGLGPVGNLAAQSAKLGGADVLGVDLSENRRRVAGACGISAESAVPAGESGFDLVIDTVCNGATLEAAASVLGENGVCSMIGIVKPKPSPEAAIFKAIWEKNLQFRSGWEMKQPLSATRNNLVCAMNRLAAGAYRIKPLLTGVVPANLEAIARAYRNLAERPDDHLCYVIDWRAA